MINNNDFKYIIKRVIIGLTIAFILFNVNKCNAKALVPKGTINYSWKNQNFSGNISSNSANKVVVFEFVSNIPKNNNDGLLIRFSKFNFVTDSNIKIDNPYLNGPSTNTYNFQCTNESSLGCTRANIYSTGQSVPSELNGNLINGNISYYGYAYDSNYQNSSICYFSSDFEDAMICPYNNATNIKYIEFYINQNGFESVNYNISLNNLQMYFNYESSEIVKGLQGVTIEQQNTTQAIEDLTANINDNNISGANNSTNSALSGIDNSVSNTLDNSISANQLNTILTNFTNQLSNTTCSPITLPIPYTKENITLPCLGTEFSQRIPVIWALYELIITGVIVLRFWQHGVEFVLNVLDPYHIGANNVPTGGGK